MVSAFRLLWQSQPISTGALVGGLRGVGFCPPRPNGCRPGRSGTCRRACAGAAKPACGDSMQLQPPTRYSSSLPAPAPARLDGPTGDRWIWPRGPTTGLTADAEGWGRVGRGGSEGDPGGERLVGYSEAPAEARPRPRGLLPAGGGTSESCTSWCLVGLPLWSPVARPCAEFPRQRARGRRSHDFAANLHPTRHLQLRGR